MAPQSRSIRRRASSSPPNSPGGASSGHRNVRHRASAKPTDGRASSSPAPSSTSPTPSSTSPASSSASPGRSSSGLRNVRRRATPTRHAPFRLSNLFLDGKIKKRHWELQTRRRQSRQKVLRPAAGENDNTSLIPKLHWGLQKRRSQTCQKVLGPAVGGNDNTSLIPDEIHELFVSEKEERKNTEFLDFLTSECAIIAIDVPGQGDGEQYLKFSRAAQMSSAALIDWLFLLRDAGFSLCGSFCASDFVVTYLGYFKARRSLGDKLTKYKVNLGKKDMAAAATLIRTEICSGASVLPADVEDLLLLLQRFKPKDSFVIRHHCSLYNELGKDVLFSSMYGGLMKLKSVDRAKYSRILGRIPYCSVTARWKDRVKKNAFLKSVLYGTGPVLKQNNPPSQKVQQASKRRVKKYKGNGNAFLNSVIVGKTGLVLKQKNPPSEKVGWAPKRCVKKYKGNRVKKYKGHGGDLLRFRRNGQQHLPDHSVVDQSTLSSATSAASAARTKGLCTMKERLKLLVGMNHQSWTIPVREQSSRNLILPRGLVSRSASWSLVVLGVDVARLDAPFLQVTSDEVVRHPDVLAPFMKNGVPCQG